MESQFATIWWVFALPIFGFLFQFLGGKIVIDNLGAKLGRPIVGAIACAPIFIAFLLAVDITVRLAQLPPESRTIILTLFDWMSVMNLSIPFEFRVDPLSMTMVLIITGIGAFIHMYATGYMAEERDYSRFFTYLNLFIACMLILVLGNNLVLLFVGWEGVGVCSYLLIGFWYKDLNNSRAANKAFIVNRIGDYGLTLGMFLIIFMIAGQREVLNITDPRWLSYDVILPNLKQIAAAYPPMMVAAAALLLFVGAMGKSAQFPLYIWLPDAMAGPTPVSALIHAATMVTSGVFLLNRMSELFSLAPLAMGVVTVIGVITALLGATIAFGQTDIKKVLAFSTVSQLGYMFIACGTGAYWAGLFHVVTHAFFKALLFLGAGAVIHAMAHNQDMRNYGNLFKWIKITAWTMLIGWLAIAGLPLLSGFWSKEEVLGAAVNSNVTLAGLPVGQLAGWIGFLVALLTAAYMTRMTMMTFFSGPERWKAIPAGHHDDHHAHADHSHAHAHAHDDHHGEDEHGFFYNDQEMKEIAAAEGHDHHHDLDSSHKPHEVPWTMWVPLVVLAFASLVGGFLMLKVMKFEYWLYPANYGHEHAEIVPHWLLIVISALVTAGGISYGYWKYRTGLPENDGLDLAKWNPLRTLAGKQWGIDGALNDGSIKIGAALGFISWKFDTWVIDGTVNLVGKISAAFGGLFGKTQTGYVRSYAWLMQLGVLAFIVFMLIMVFRAGGAL